MLSDMPVTSVIDRIRRRPLESRPICTMKSIAFEIWRRRLDSVPWKPAKPASISSRYRHSRGELAWIVPIEPSWPVFIACSISSTSPPRTSPTMMRSGRIRSVLRSRSRMVTTPVPSKPPGRLSSRTTCGWFSDSSAVSSMVTTRSFSGTWNASALSSEVLPELVPPDTRMLQRASTAASSSVLISSL